MYFYDVCIQLFQHEARHEDLLYVCERHQASLVIFSAVRSESFQPCLLASVNVHDSTDKKVAF